MRGILPMYEYTSAGAAANACSKRPTAEEMELASLKCGKVYGVYKVPFSGAYSAVRAGICAS